MKNAFRLSLLFLLLPIFSCDDSDDVAPEIMIPNSTTSVPGKAVIKVLQHSQGWVSLQETLQPQYLVTQPKRELVWRGPDFQSLSSYTPPEGWSLIDAVAHPSGQVSAVLVNLEIQRDPFFQIKILRLQNGASITEALLEALPIGGELTKYFPGSLDRVRLEAYEEDVYVVARWDYNQVEASRFSFSGSQFQLTWQKLVEPDTYAGSIGIIGGGYDNFHQGDRYYFVYSGVDAQGNLYVAVPSHEDLLFQHDATFNENLMEEADPANYDWGVAVLTKVSPSGERKYARLSGRSYKKRLLSMRVGEGNVYLVGREKTGTDPGSWDAWILAAETSSGNTKYERQIDIQDGDMFWDIDPFPGGRVLAVGTKGYFQNPGGLSVSDSRFATAIIINGQGAIEKEIDLPQGPSERGSETMFVKLFGRESVVFAGVHNAPGTHAEVYCDGFIAVRDLAIEEN